MFFSHFVEYSQARSVSITYPNNFVDWKAWWPKRARVFVTIGSSISVVNSNECNHLHSSSNDGYYNIIGRSNECFAIDYRYVNKVLLEISLSYLLVVRFNSSVCNFIFIVMNLIQPYWICNYSRMNVRKPVTMERYHQEISRGSLSVLLVFL